MQFKSDLPVVCLSFDLVVLCVANFDPDTVITLHQLTCGLDSHLNQVCLLVKKVLLTEFVRLVLALRRREHHIERECLIEVSCA